MHAPSALLTGAVLTFGAAALGNLYLPAAAQGASAAPAPFEYLDSSTEDRLTYHVPEDLPAEPEDISSSESVVEKEPPAQPAAARPAAQPKAAAAPAPKKESQAAQRIGTAPSKTAGEIFGAAASAAPVQPAAPKAQAAPFSVSAISGDRAWIRVGNTRTVVVQAGADIPGLGVVASITPDSVVLENGMTIRSP